MPHRPLRTSVVTAVALAAAIVAPLGPHTAGHASAVDSGPVVGADISWPECPSTMGIPTRRGENKPPPPRTSKFVVVGLTNGPGFFPNPCLERQVRWIKNHHVYAAAYAMTTYPYPRHLRKYGTTGPYGKRHPLGRLRNAGYNQATFNVATMKRVGLESPIVWVDIEPYPVAPWSRNHLSNRAVVEGAVRGYTDAGYRVGFYSTKYLWREVLGNVRYGRPEWRTAGQTSMGAALSKCSNYTFQGGRGVMAQWWIPSKDFDVMCPGYGSQTSMRRWFHKY